MPPAPARNPLAASFMKTFFKRITISTETFLLSCNHDTPTSTTPYLSAVVDLKTGKVYNGLPSGIGYSFNKDSRLMVVNPPDSTNLFDITIPFAIPEEYEWTGKEFIRIKTSS